MTKLPPPRKDGNVSIERTIQNRRSVRDFEAVPLTDVELSQLLWAAQGITDDTRHLRSAPSAGATYPLETYAVTVEGVFHYNPEEHALSVVIENDVRNDLSKAALGQSSVRKAPLVLVFTAVPERTRQRYGDRTDRYIAMEAGHAAENVHLEAVALGLASVPVGAFDDAAIAKILRLEKTEKPLYLIPVGHAKTTNP